MLPGSNQFLKNPKKILLATHNPSKIKRFQEKLESKDFILISPAEAGLKSVEAKEIGKDEYLNSEIKAKAYFKASRGIVSLSLDTGVYIDGLADENQPAKDVQKIAGVKEDDSDETRYQKMIDFYTNIASQFDGRAKAYFKDVFCLFDGERTYFSEARREAILTDKVFKKDVNFPIASIYKIPKFNKYYHDLTDIEMQEYIEPSFLAARKVLENIK